MTKLKAKKELIVEGYQGLLLNEDMRRFWQGTNPRLLVSYLSIPSRESVAWEIHIVDNQKDQYMWVWKNRQLGISMRVY
ncbi:hypothetical protein Ccrd_020847 [Cynara cardunculus var. scolymus]|uniref:Uncharacterized protein n=1 Tax=Cynara cardunculus var. scolymus TaxID=59895 RepID=A0A103Y1P0_CYNCS|nr:hypothetical protein Ccrd_020847 [Cynara cardunculus var. scolymus]